jgi:predicted transcriptional regulator YdeE
MMVCAAAAALLVCVGLAEVSMKPKIVELGQFQVVGTEVSTNNQKEAGPDGVLGKQWQQFLSQGLLRQVPDRVDDNILAVYTDYSSDANGEYTFVLGAKVRPIPNPTIPSGMVVKTVPAGKYAVFTSERGPVAKVLSKRGNRSGRTTNRLRMVSTPTVRISRSTTSAPPIPTTRRWKFVLG